MSELEEFLAFSTMSTLRSLTLVRIHLLIEMDGAHAVWQALCQGLGYSNGEEEGSAHTYACGTRCRVTS